MGNCNHYTKPEASEMIRSEADYALTNCTIYTGEQVLNNHAVLVKGEQIL